MVIRLMWLKPAFEWGRHEDGGKVRVQEIKRHTSVKKIALGRVLACLKKDVFVGVSPKQGRLGKVTVADRDRPVFQVQKLCSVLLLLRLGGRVHFRRAACLHSQPDRRSAHSGSSLFRWVKTAHPFLFSKLILFLLNATHFEINILASHHATALQITDYVTKRMRVSVPVTWYVFAHSSHEFVVNTIVLNWVAQVNNLI